MKGEDGNWKICDFGSCTTEHCNDPKNTSIEIKDRIKDEIEKVTTPNYRAPEQLDFFKGYKINQKVDIWALGCVMYTLMFHKPPFLEGEKLAQINGKFKLPSSPTYSVFCISLMTSMFRVDPDQRPDAQQIFSAIQNSSIHYVKQIQQQNASLEQNFMNLNLNNFVQGDTKIFSEIKNIRRSIDLQDDQIISHKIEMKLALQNNTDYKYSYKDHDNRETQQNVDYAYSLRAPSQFSQSSAFGTSKRLKGLSGLKIKTLEIDQLLEVIPENSFDQSFDNKQEKAMTPRINQTIEFKEFQSPLKQCQSLLAELIQVNNQDKQNGLSGYISEKQLREIIFILHKDEFNESKEGLGNRKVFLNSFNNLQKAMNEPAYALRFLMICQRLLLFTPHIFEQDQNSFNGITKILYIIENIKEIYKNRLQKNAEVSQTEDQLFRMRIITYLAGFLLNKLQKLEDFGYLIDSAYNLRGVTNSIAFEGDGTEEGRRRLNPLKVMFLEALNNLWSHIEALNHKIFTGAIPSFDREIRIQLALLILEEQLQIFGTISHLYAAFILQLDLARPVMLTSLTQSFDQFLSKFCMEIHRNFESLISLLETIKKNQELAHLSSRLPKPPIDFLPLVNEAKDQFIQQQQKNQVLVQKLNLIQILNIQAELPGNFRMPVPFRPYCEFVNQAHQKYEFLLGWKIFRERLGQKYQVDILRKMQPTRRGSIIGNVQEIGQQMEQNKVQQKNEMMQRMKSYQSHSVSELIETQNLVNQVMQKQNQNPNSYINYRINEAPVVKKFNLDLPLKISQMNAPGRKETVSLRSSEIAFIRDIDEQGIESMRDSINSSNINNPKSTESQKQVQINQNINSYEAQLSEIFNQDWENFMKEGQNLKQQVNNQASNQVVKDSNKQGDFFQWDQKYGNQQNQNQKVQPQIQENILQQQKNQQNQNVQAMPNDAKQINSKIQGANNQDKKINQILINDDLRKSFRTSQFDSNCSDYLLLVNIKNKEEVKRRQRVKKRLETEPDVFDDVNTEYIIKEHQKTKKQMELIQELQQQSKQAEEANKNLMELQRKQTQIFEIKQQKIEIEAQKKFEEENLALANQTKELNELQERLKKQEEEMKKQLDEYEEKLKVDEQQIKADKIKLEVISEKLKKQNEVLIEKEKVFEQKMLDISMQSIKTSEISSDDFKPDSDNKDKNIAVQFIDFILRKRPHQKIDLRELTDLVKIGEGSAANVYRALYKFTSVAVKQLKAQTLIKNNQLSKEFQREVTALVQMSHPNLVMFMGATADQGHPVIVTEFCDGGTLFEVLHENKKDLPVITFKQRHKMVLDIAKAMYFMHNLPEPLMHRDLKSLNILVQNKITSPNDLVQCKVTDFGLARSPDIENEMLTGMAGTFHWMAPEVMENSPYTLKADVYSFGIVMWEILSREPPFADYPPHKIMYNVINYKERPPVSKIEAGCPPELILIMKACWEQDPNKRPSFMDVIVGLNSMTILN